MANKAPIVGLRPMADAKGQVNTRGPVAISSSNAVDLFIGSPYAISGGKIIGIPDNADENTKIAGAIVALFKNNGCVVQNVKASTDGYMAEVSYEADQEYVITVDDDGFADDGTDNGKAYLLTDETATAGSDGFEGDPCSQRQIDGSTEHATDGQMIVSRKSGLIGNQGGVAGTEVVARIKPANHQAW